MVVLKKEQPCFDRQDVTILKNDGPRFMRQVQINLKLDKEPLSDLNDTEKRVLLAYVVYLRQNVTTESGDRPNEEDAARILHGEVFDDKGKKKLDKELLSQLSKIGLDIKIDESEEGE